MITHQAKNRARSAGGRARRRACAWPTGLALLLAAASQATASPWTQWRNEYQLTVRYTHTHHDELVLYDRSRKQTDLDYDNVALNAVYPFTDRWSVSLDAPYEQAEGQDSAMAPKVSGWGDLRAAVRAQILGELEWPLAAAMELGIKVPGEDYRTDVLTAPGDGQIDTEARLSVGQTFSLPPGEAYWSLEPAYRWRAESPGDEFVLDTSVGQRVCRWAQVYLFYQRVDQLSGYGLEAPDWPMGDFPSIEEDIDRVGGGLMLGPVRGLDINLFYADIVHVNNSALGWSAGVSVSYSRRGQ